MKNKRNRGQRCKPEKRTPYKKQPWWLPKLPAAQRNEVLLKCLVYNCTVLVHAMYELGIEPTFGGQAVAS
jgi:hypothetical protein